MAALIILLVIAAGLVFVVVGIYNGLVRARNEVKNAWSSIDVQLKRRYDLIPNLVEAVKGYAGHERQTSKRSQRPGSRPSASQEAWRSVPKSRMCLPKRCAPSSPWPRPIRTSRPIKTSSRCRKKYRTPKTRSGFPASTTTTRSCATRIVSRSSPATSSPVVFNFQAEPFFETEAPGERVAPQVKF